MDPGESKQLDPHRLTAWHAEYAPRLRAFVRGLVADDSSTDEVVQATFAKALSHGLDVRPGAEKAWLFQVAFHEAMALKRKADVHQRSLGRVHSPAHPPTAEQLFLQEETVKRVRAAVHRLPAEQQQVLQRRIYQEQTFQEIADELHLPLGTVLTRMRTALQKLQKFLAEPS